MKDGKKRETINISENVKADLVIDVFDFEEFDTSVEISGCFCVAGVNRKEFCLKLGSLIDEYRI